MSNSRASSCLGNQPVGSYVLDATLRLYQLSGWENPYNETAELLMAAIEMTLKICLDGENFEVDPAFHSASTFQWGLTVEVGFERLANSSGYWFHS